VTGGKFPEKGAVFAGEPPELPEAELRGDLGCRRSSWRTLAQGPAAPDAFGAVADIAGGSFPAAPGNMSVMSVRHRDRGAELRPHREFPPSPCETGASSRRAAAAPTGAREPPCRRDKQPWLRSTPVRDCALLRHGQITAGASSASCPAAACSRWSVAIAAGGGVTLSVFFGSVRSHPAVAVPKEIISSTGSDMAPEQAGPDER
jgi:hypothetical protein